MLPVFLSGSQSDSWLKVAQALLDTRHILQQNHMRAIHNTDNNSKAHCHLREKPRFFRQSFMIWLIYHSRELTSHSAMSAAAWCSSFWGLGVCVVFIICVFKAYEEKWRRKHGGGEYHTENIPLSDSYYDVPWLVARVLYILFIVVYNRAKWWKYESLWS